MMKRWWHGLTNRGRVLTAVGLTGAMLLVGIPLNVAAIGFLGSVPTATSQQAVAEVDEAAARATPAPTRSSSPTPTPTPTPVVTVEIVEVREAVAFESVSIDEPDMEIGASAITTAGKAGTRVKTFEVTMVDGVETKRVLASENVTVTPVQEVTSVGTKAPYVAPAPVAAPAPAPAPTPAPAASGCDSNYAGACVPIDSDVDCAGGSGNGPSYVAGPVSVVGSDIYDLDRDGDGIACD